MGFVEDSLEVFAVAVPNAIFPGTSGCECVTDGSNVNLGWDESELCGLEMPLLPLLLLVVSLDVDFSLVETAESPNPNTLG